MTVVICVYNAGEWLRPSVMSIVNQSYRNLEILIIDDGSTDGCMDNLADMNDPRIRFLSQPNGGKPAALNRAISELRGEFFAVQDADDLSNPHRIERQVRTMLDHPDVAAVFTGYELILDGQHVAPTFRSRGIEQCRHDIESFRMPGHDATVMFRSAMVRGMLYDPALTLGEGHDFILQVGERYPLIVLGECLLSYRIRNESLTAREADNSEYFTRQVICRACNRRGLERPPDRVEQVSTCNTPKRRRLVPHFMDSVVSLKEAGRSWEVFETALICSRLRRGRFYYYRPLLYAVAPLWLIQYYRSWRARTEGSRN